MKNRLLGRGVGSKRIFIPCLRMYIPWVEQGHQKNYFVGRRGGGGKQGCQKFLLEGGGVRFMQILGCLETCAVPIFIL